MVKTVNLQPLLDAQQNQLDIVLSEADGIDTKALALLGTNVAILLFTAQAGLHFNALWQHVVFLTPFIVSLSFNIAAVWPRQYIGAIVDLKQHAEYFQLDEQHMISQLLADTIEYTAINTQINQHRWRLCLIALLMLALGSLWLFVIL